MMPAKRQKVILKYINKHGSANIKELLELLKVSESTIRRDLKKISEKNLIERTHGGAVKTTMSTSFEALPQEKRCKNLKEKKYIADICEKFILDGESILLDAGSTNYFISQKLKNKNNITVITVDLRIALKTKLKSDSNLIVPGGRRREDYEVLVGTEVENFLKNLSVDKAFIGADAVSIEKGITNATFPEVGIKKEMIKSAKESFLVADHTKFGSNSLVKVANLEKIEYVITDKKIDSEVVDKLEEIGIWVEN